jgi:hypothetical protein
MGKNTAPIAHFQINEKMPDKDYNSFAGKNWGTEPIELHVDSIAQEYRPIELHHKDNGTLDGKPSFAIVMVQPHALLGKVYGIGQISVEMLTKALDECGYTLTKK